MFNKVYVVPKTTSYSKKHKVHVMSQEEAQAMWDKGWELYLQTVQEEGYEDRHIPASFWITPMDI
jgi:hypothetical protein